jgi:hypothetical protein
MLVEGWPTPRGVDHTTKSNIHWQFFFSQGPKSQSLMVIRSKFYKFFCFVLSSHRLVVVWVDHKN